MSASLTFAAFKGCRWWKEEDAEAASIAGTAVCGGGAAAPPLVPTARYSTSDHIHDTRSVLDVMHMTTTSTR
eukprot:11310-Eustigmatos_ZCMA.PRE.1